MELEHLIHQIDLTLDAPEDEPMRQYYFLAKARQYV